MNNKHIVIVGGGSAGWITASLLIHYLGTNHDITLIESPDVPTIGVGEGSTPHLVKLFSTLGIEESDWMPDCFATYKNGIEFQGWSASGRANHYFHPFPSAIDQTTLPAFLAMSEANRKGQGPWVNPSEYFLTACLANLGKTPKNHENAVKTSLNYGYHFDASQLARILKKYSLKQGVKYIIANVDTVTRNQNGDICELHLQQDHVRSADWYFDCTGFTGHLVKQSLDVPFVSYKKYLLNDTAVACQSTQQAHFKTQTLAKAQDYGWSWHIPLTNRIGNGYVYASDYVDETTVKNTLLTQIGINSDTALTRRIKFETGRLTNNWVNNCIAVGLSQGFIEPLEATALHLVQESVEQFISAYCAGNQSAQHRDQYNQLIAQRFDGIKDYILAHYLCANRSDTAYWRYYQTLTDIPDHLANILDKWNSGEDIANYIMQNGLHVYYSPVSWYCLLMGYDMGTTTSAFPPTHPVNKQHLVVQDKINVWVERFK